MSHRQCLERPWHLAVPQKGELFLGLQDNSEFPAPGSLGTLQRWHGGGTQQTHAGAQGRGRKEPSVERGKWPHGRRVGCRAATGTKRSASLPALMSQEDKARPVSLRQTPPPGSSCLPQHTGISLCEACRHTIVPLCHGSLRQVPH